jgi:hypothetical protein
MATCYANTAPTYQPARRIISAVTNAEEAEVTTTTDHDYIDGEIIRFYVPEGYGMTQLNQKLATVTVTATNKFTINIDTTNFDSFGAPSSFPFNEQCAQIVPVGEINATFAGATKNVLPTGDR